MTLLYEDVRIHTRYIMTRAQPVTPVCNLYMCLYVRFKISSTEL